MKRKRWRAFLRNRAVIGILRLGLVKRRTPDLQTAIEITDRFAEIFPDDPTKGDFALFGYGVNN
ncbi:DUF2400 domain-containing protein, partial [Acetobacter estunensis]|nr:DUF2400 domain-containing protein [Acetobacter estunensis]